MIGVAKILGLGGAPTMVVVQNAGRDELMSTTDYSLALLKPDLAQLPWRRTELPPLPAGAPDDFDADRGSDARIAEIHPPNLGVNPRGRAGTLVIDWHRKVRPAELQRYLEESRVPSWIEEFERIWSADILSVSAALQAAKPQDEAELSTALAGFDVTRNDRVDRR